ncbi:hypothetical protein CHF27_005270 [Romboutsia maritimum]|uniref:Uncharacterized protein n=1 Tax=Romboutsia maritimum TaxID=2020948 RepID=A0A371IU46_9FIRM|nr:hypothetical protein [Romboutsia maritimum]RDY23993.1 hypothetical protein CHF27_005270 [Romboutsia maritimum]
MKNIITLLKFFIIISILIFVNLLFYKPNSVNLFFTSYAKTCKLNDNYNLILSILKDSNKINLLPYADYIELNKITSIPNDTEGKIAFTLSLPQQLSFIVIYEKIDENNYKFEASIDNLASINNFYFYKNFLVIEQSESKCSKQRDFFQVFLKKNNNYISVFNKNIYNEKIINQHASQDLIKEIETCSIDFLDGDSPRILCIYTLTKYKSFYTLSQEQEFREIKKTTNKVVYEWDFNNQSFKIN